ncbi:hypothetical protein JTB14_026631 [Gonioctena quinquepunctata]|nr:hypothetical protein JTB14_026631 [Gonioctena quinquepunctata]
MADEEDMLANAIGVAADWGYPCDSNDIKDIVQNYLGRHGRTAPQFVNNRPGETWLQFFLLRHKEKLSKRLSQSIKESRAKVCHETVNNYFDNLAESLKDVPPSAVVNYDETNFTDDPGRVKVIVRKSCKRAEKIMDSSKAATSVMFACAASGSLLPIYIVYKADHLWSTWTENGPPGARFNRSHSGWFDGNIFEDRFINIILPYFRTSTLGPKVLISDNLASHISITVIQKCEENETRFILLPPNSTHLTQPLDQWKNKRGVVKKDVFSRLLNQALNHVEASGEKNIKSGFEATGICPLNRKKVLDKLPKTDEPALPGDMAQSLKEIFENSRFKTAVTVGRKKKLTVPASRSISRHYVEMPQTSSGKKTIAKSKNKQTRSSSSASSESAISEKLLTVDSDADPESFSDLENERDMDQHNTNKNDIPRSDLNDLKSGRGRWYCEKDRN